MDFMKNIKTLAIQFRNAIDKAQEEREFYKDRILRNFPCGCCDITSELVAQYLMEKNIIAARVCGTYRDGNPEHTQSHVWLLVDNQIIIDITGDQFKYNSDLLNYRKTVYVGLEDAFHNLFEDKKICGYGKDGIFSMNDEINTLYFNIRKYIVEI